MARRGLSARGFGHGNEANQARPYLHTRRLPNAANPPDKRAKRGSSNAKLNGWRALVHCPSGTMWNRHGGRLSIAGEFASPLRELRKFSGRGLVWADCEAMGRRHKIGCGTLIVLDWIAEDASPIYEERRAFLEKLVPLETMSAGEGAIPANSLLLTPSIADADGAALRLYESLRSINRSARADVFEGVVMKRGGSLYPVQLRSAGEECRAWCKHRWLV